MASRGRRQLAWDAQFAHPPGMLALDFIKANRDTVERAIHDKGVELDLDELLALDTAVRGLKTEIDRLRHRRENGASAGPLSDSWGL